MIPLDPSPEPENIMQGTVSSSETAKESVAPTVGADGSAPKIAQRMTQAEYHATLAERFGEDEINWRVVCPSCGTAQSFADLFAAAHATTADAKNRVATMFAYSCIGRLMGATGAFDRKKFAPCNYTSGGLFCINSLFVVLPDGREIPAFVPADAA